jgi:MarR family transcriptional regulator for hemolysin
MQTKSSDCPETRQQMRERLGLLIGGVYRQWRRQVDLSFRDLALTDATRAPLLALYVHDQPMRQKALAEALALDTSSLVRVLGQLRERQLVQWHHEPQDRRAKCISLTEAGREIARQILQRSLEIEQQLLADLSDEERHITRGALEKILRRFAQL